METWRICYQTEVKISQKYRCDRGVYPYLDLGGGAFCYKRAPEGGPGEEKKGKEKDEEKKWGGGAGEKGKQRWELEGEEERSRTCLAANKIIDPLLIRSC